MIISTFNTDFDINPLYGPTARKKTNCTTVEKVDMFGQNGVDFLNSWKKLLGIYPGQMYNLR